MAITAALFAVYEDDPALVDCRVDLLVPNVNGGGTYSMSFLVDRSTLPSGYTNQDLAAACTTILDTSGITCIVADYFS